MIRNDKTTDLQRVGRIAMTGVLLSIPFLFIVPKLILFKTIDNGNIVYVDLPEGKGGLYRVVEKRGDNIFVTSVETSKSLLVPKDVVRK